MVAHQPKDGVPQDGSVLQTWNFALTQNKAKVGANCHGWSPTKIFLTQTNCDGWSPTISRMVAHHPKDGHPPKGSVIQTWNSAFTQTNSR